jgi:hypothetical protein
MCEKQTSGDRLPLPDVAGSPVRLLGSRTGKTLVVTVRKK